MRLLFIIDPPSALNPKKDSTIALMRGAARRGDDVYCAEMRDLMVREGAVHVRASELEMLPLDDSAPVWHRVMECSEQPATAFDAVLMRKEPPVDENFVMATRLLDIINRDVAVVNHPRALREQNEKLSILDFPDLIPPTWVGADVAAAEEFRRAHGSVVLKPLNGMGGQGIYVSAAEDRNFRSVFELLAGEGRMIMAQAYMPAAREGDYRVFALNGAALPWMLARFPREDDHRGNLAAGGTPEARPLDDAAARIAAVVAPQLAARGVRFAGLDVIGGKLIEINITCPTGLVEVGEQTSEQGGKDIAGDVLAGMVDAPPN